MCTLLDDGGCRAQDVGRLLNAQLLLPQENVRDAVLLRHFFQLERCNLLEVQRPDKETAHMSGRAVSGRRAAPEHHVALAGGVASAGIGKTSSNDDVADAVSIHVAHGADRQP